MTVHGRSAGARGFTLLELLVAIAIVAVVAALAFGGLRQITGAADRLLPRYQDLQRWQFALSVIEQDVENAVPRGVRDELGTPQPALRGGIDGVLLEVTRRVPAGIDGEASVRLRRVSYRLSDGALYRDLWPVLDRTQATAPRSRRLLDGLDRCSLRFLPQPRDGADWLPFWPRAAAAAAQDGLPRAVEIVLTGTDAREVRRLLLLPAL